MDENVRIYFPSLDTLFNWVRKPFIDDAYDNTQLTTVEDNDLSDTREDSGLKLEYTKLVQDTEEESRKTKRRKNLIMWPFGCPTYE